MKRVLRVFIAALICNLSAIGNVLYVDSASTHPVPPYADWSTAASRIQDAIEAASAGDTIWVTNGTYSAGGKVITDDLTNRVVLDKAVLVQSVNGPLTTTIQGVWDPTKTNGPLAVRCAWLTNGAVLAGFTLQGGATRSSGASDSTLAGGAWCASSQAVLSNCVIRANSGYGSVGGVYQGTLKLCVVTGNRAPSWAAGGCYRAVLNNCTVSYNTGLGTTFGKLTNSIVYFNAAGNYSLDSLYFCCSTPLPSGAGNISADPQFLSDGFHLAGTSPCRAAGTNPATATDIDGQPWSSPPAMGCDEWKPEPIVVTAPQVQMLANPPGFSLTVAGAGQSPLNWGWLKDGVELQDDGHFTSTHSSTLVVSGVQAADTGQYAAVVSNAFGISTSLVATVVIHCVDANAAAPTPPYSSWATAATTIQDAIDVAAPGDFVLVTNGVYSTGGKVMAGDLTNRVALDKPITVQSLNGPAATTILGNWDPSTTNGPLAVRCAWLMDGAILSGFTLQGGATRSVGDFWMMQSGGGVWGQSTNARVLNCLIHTNAAAYGGGGCYQAQLERCRIIGNVCSSGAGCYQATLFNCLVQANSGVTGAGTHSSRLFNSTVTLNHASSIAGGTYQPFAFNSVVYNNTAGPVGFPSSIGANWSGGYFYYSCTSPAPSGGNNITDDPQLLDNIHLTSTSPCIGAGSTNYSTGLDIDGEPWANPPSMGCDEFVASGITGPLSVQVSSSWGTAVVSRVSFLYAQCAGQASRAEWSFGDGATLTNVSQLVVHHAWTNPGDYTVTFTAYNYDHPNGVSASLPMHVVPLAAPVLSAGSLNSNAFGLSFYGQYGVVYYVESATNLTAPILWQTVTALVGNDRPVSVSDSAATNAARFYRVRIP